MADNKKTPVEQVDEDLRKLEAKSEGKLAGLADKLSTAFWGQVKHFLILYGTVLQRLSSNFWDRTFIEPITIVTNLFKTGPKTLKPTEVKDILKSESSPDVILDRLKSLSEKEPILQWVFSLLEYSAAITGITMGNLSIVSELSKQDLSKQFRQSLLPFESAIQSYFIDPDKRNQVTETLSKYGFSDEKIDMIFKSSQQLLSPDILRDAFLREKITEPVFTQKLKQLRMSDENIDIIKSVINQIPPIQDIITMAVREVFTPAIKEKFGQDQDYPSDVSEWGKKAGISEFWLKNYWAAHWRLPSVLQGFQMLHRGVIDQPELDMLLRAADVMPYWRDKLTAIGYNPLTRVDVRRMYGLGVLDEDAVNKAYHDVGYNDVNAALMTDFTIKYQQGADRELTKTDIIALYKDYAIKSDDCLTKLKAIGYSDDDAQLIITKADFDKYAKYKKSIISFTSIAYIAGKISQTEALNRLGKLDMPADEVNYLINTWDSKRASKVKYLSLDNLKAFYAQHIISTAELVQELQELGYNNQDTGRFVRLFSTSKTK